MLKPIPEAEIPLSIINVSSCEGLNSDYYTRTLVQSEYHDLAFAVRYELLEMIDLQALVIF